MRDTNSIGAKTEGRVLAALLSAGKTVLLPFGVQGYDLVYEEAGKFHRVQCKTAHMYNGCMIFHAMSRTGDNRKTLASYIGRADYFGVYCPYSDQCYLIPVEEVQGKEGWYRVDPPKNNQTKGVKFAQDYLII